MLISGGWSPRPVTMTLIDSCGETESGMGGLCYREMLHEILEFQFSGPIAAMALNLEREHTQSVIRSIVSAPIRTVSVMPLVKRNTIFRLQSGSRVYNFE